MSTLDPKHPTSEAAPKSNILLVLIFIAAVVFAITALINYQGTLLPWLKQSVSSVSSTTSSQGERPVVARGNLAEDEQSTIELFRQAAPSVVYISTATVVSNPLNLNVQDVPQGTGSGFVWNNEGLIVTNFHVIQNADTAKVILADQTAWDARLVGIAPHKDLAVLKITAPPERLIPIPLGTSGDLQVGQKVFAIGNPFGLDHTLTTGIVSGLDREIRSVTGRPITGVIQTDAAINPGNSGGPLLDSAGRLIGINTAIKSPSGVYAGIGFAVPVNMVNRIVPELIAHGKFRRPVLGIEIFDDRTVLALKQNGVIETQGVLVKHVRPDSAAEQAGLRPTYDRTRLGDLIVAINDQRIETMDDLFKTLDQCEVGQEVQVKAIRDGEPVEFLIVLQPLE